jgi:hypothetical protein
MAGSDQGRVSEGSVSPLWSVDLPGGGLLPDRSGGCLVATRAGLASFARDGRLRWQTAALGDAPELPVQAPDGAVVRVEGDAVVTRDAATGQVVRSFAALRAARLAVAPWGGLVHSEYDPAGTATLCATTFDGERMWSRKLAERAHPAYRPLAVEDAVVVCQLGRLTAFDHSGSVGWSAGRDRFHDQDLNEDVAGRDADRVWSEPLRAGPAAVLFGLRWDTGIELFLADAATRTVRSYVSSVVARNPIAVVRPIEDGLRVAAQGPRFEVRQMDYRWPVVLLDESGARVWQHPFPVEPRGLYAGIGGSLIVTASPSRKRWELYGRWQDLSKDVFVCCLDADGAQRWIWYPPGPLSTGAVVGPDGVIYVGAAGKLWALPSD